MAPVDERSVQHEVPDVVETRPHHRSDPVDDVRHAVGRGEHVVAAVVRTEDVLRVHEPRHLEAGERQRRGGDVHQADEICPSRAGLHDLGKSRRDDDQRDPQAFVVGELLAPGQVRAVVGEEHHDGALPESVGLELRHQLADLVVGAQDRVVVVGDVPAHLGNVGILRRHRHVRRLHGPQGLAPSLPRRCSRRPCRRPPSCARRTACLPTRRASVRLPDGPFQDGISDDSAPIV